MLYKKENVFDKFLKNREFLILQFKKGDLSKKEFIELNFDFINKMNLKPFKKIDSFEKGMYNYQYYNSIAKYYCIKAKDIKAKGKHPKLYKKYIEKTNYFYWKKDQSTFQLLKHLNFSNIEAYFIKVNSRFLKDKLYEIVLMDYDNTILHSKSQWLLQILKDRNVFINEKRKSLVDRYVNQKY